jgi:hypothetical protein
MTNSTILAMFETGLSESGKSANLIEKMAVLGWNFTIYSNNTIYLRKQKIELSDEDVASLRAALPEYNSGKKSYMQIEF